VKGVRTAEEVARDLGRLAGAPAGADSQSGEWIRLEGGGASARRVKSLLVDLNNFSTFPTLAVGLLVAALRNAGHEAEVLSPLAHDVPAAERERRERRWDDWARRLHLSQDPRLTAVRDAARGVRTWWRERPHPRTLRAVAEALDRGPEVVLLSAYLQHRRTVEAIGRLAEERGIPVLLGGPAFNLPRTAEAWRGVTGVRAIVGAEVDRSLPELVRTLVEGGDLLQFPGVLLPDGRRSAVAAPLKRLDETPVPDFTDFPWDRYRTRVIPVMTGRGCQWAECVFCSDVHTAGMRLFRTRSVESVLHELEEQARRHQTRNFLFLDLKLNSSPALLRGLVAGLQRRVPGAQWIGTVHVDGREDNGLSRSELRAAVAAGMRRVSFGLESGSQRMLDAMRKGSTVEGNSRFIRDAHAAGLSVRCTMFRGFPGETADDLHQTAAFLEAHEAQLDRVRFNDLSIHEGTSMHSALEADPQAYPGLRVRGPEAARAKLRYSSSIGRKHEERAALDRVLRVVHAINRRPVRSAARAFDGLM
jgi:anaerobic magnesium-protoporphyrin IX monomethyl ester cyclase